MFSNQMSAMTGMKPGKKTHRGKRGGRNKPKNPHHAQAQTHLANALKAPTPDAAHQHLFKALTALNKARAPGAQASAGAAPQPPAVSSGTATMAPSAPPGGQPNGY